MLANVQVWNPGETGMIVAPNHIALKNVILPELSKWGILDAWDYSGPQSAQPGLHAPNGTRVLLESASSQRKIERLRGPTLAWFWMDEAAIIPKKAWQILTGRLRTGAYRNAWITTTPRGFNWVYDKFHPDSDDQLKSVNNVLGVPSYANPHLPLDYRRDILDEWTGHFRAQEVEGAFVQPEGLVHDWFDRDTNVVSYEDVPESFDRFLYGVDWGFYPHPACILCIGVRDRLYYVLEEHYETRNTVGDLVDVLAGTDDAPGMVDRGATDPSTVTRRNRRTSSNSRRTASTPRRPTTAWSRASNTLPHSRIGFASSRRVRTSSTSSISTAIRTTATRSSRRTITHKTPAGMPYSPTRIARPRR